MYSPLVSIIIPVYNCEAYIKDTINNILNSIYSDIEIICIDDGSSDNSFAIIKELSVQNSKIKYLSQSNQGVSIARNNGLKHANGKYVMFVDSDDLIKPDAISKSIEYLEKNNADIICFNMLIRTQDHEDNICFQEHHFDSYLTICNSKDYDKAVNFTNAAPSVIKKEFLEKHNIQFIPKHIYEDWVFMVEIFSKNPYCVFLNEPMYIYNKREQGSITCDISSSCLDLFDSYKISDNILKNVNLNSSWVQINDAKIFNEALNFFLCKIVKSKKTKVFKEYSQSIKDLIADFNIVYIESLLSNKSEKFKNVIEYISSKKCFKKSSFKKFIHKKVMIKSFSTFISHFCSYWYYTLRGIVSND